MALCTLIYLTCITNSMFFHLKHVISFSNSVDSDTLPAATWTGNDTPLLHFRSLVAAAQDTK